MAQGKLLSEIPGETVSRTDLSQSFEDRGLRNLLERVIGVATKISMCLCSAVNLASKSIMASFTHGRRVAWT